MYNNEKKLLSSLVNVRILLLCEIAMRNSKYASMSLLFMTSLGSNTDGRLMALLRSLIMIKIM